MLSGILQTFDFTTWRLHLIKGTTMQNEIIAGVFAATYSC